jgi:hypothetical protein
VAALPPACPVPGWYRGRVTSLLAPAHVVLRDVPLAIDPVEVRAFQGYKPLALRPPGELDARLTAARQVVAGLARPALAYRIVPVTAAGPDHLDLAGGHRFHIPAIGVHWSSVEAVAAAVVTIGDGAEAAVRARRAAGDGPGASDLDSAASAAVECLAEWANDELCRRGVAAGLRVTNRISPGLAGWSLRDQARLVELADGVALGVRQSADGALVPAKTISFLAGIGRDARIDHYFVQCRRCWVEGCGWRRMAAVARVHRDD